MALRTGRKPLFPVSARRQPCSRIRRCSGITVCRMSIWRRKMVEVFRDSDAALGRHDFGERLHNCALPLSIRERVQLSLEIGSACSGEPWKSCSSVPFAFRAMAAYARGDTLGGTPGRNRGARAATPAPARCEIPLAQMRRLHRAGWQRTSLRRSGRTDCMSPPSLFM
jgi:hypothetical protein